MLKNPKILAPLYFIAFIASLITFFVGDNWVWLPIAAVWLLLGCYYFRDNRNDNNNELKK